MPEARRALVVFAPALDVAHLEAGEFEIGDGAAEIVELAAGKDVARQRLELRPLLAGARGVAPAGAGDGVMQVESAGFSRRWTVSKYVSKLARPTCSNMPTDTILSKRPRPREAHSPLLERDLVGSPRRSAFSRANAICRSDTSRRARSRRNARPRGRRASPSRCRCEQLLARLKTQLAAGHVELLPLRLIEIVVPVMEIGAGVDHVAVEPERIEGVGDIIVIRDIALVFGLRPIAFPVAAEASRGHGPPRGNEQERGERAQGRQRVERLAQFARPALRSARHEDRRSCRSQGRSAPPPTDWRMW